MRAATGSDFDEIVGLREQIGPNQDGLALTEHLIAESFRGKSRVQQHKLVYDALKGQMGGALHALALQTGLPEK